MVTGFVTGLAPRVGRHACAATSLHSSSAADSIVGPRVPLRHHARGQRSSRRVVIPRATAAPANSSDRSDEANSTPVAAESERAVPFLRKVVKVALMLAISVLILVALNAGLTRFVAPSTKTRAAVNLLTLGFAFSSWWISVSSSSSGAAARPTPAELLPKSDLAPRLDRGAVSLPFSDGKFWDFKIFPKTHRLFGRTFTSKDVVVASVFLFLHAVSLLAPFTATRSAVLSFFALHIITGMVGITFSYHRQLTHRAFATPKWIEYPAAWIGCLTLQGDPIEWVSAHRHHHHSCDTEDDPHSPFDGFFWSHMGWMWDERNTPVLQDTSNCPELWRQPYYVFLKKTYPLHPAAFAGVMYALGGLPFIVWGVALRTVSMWHTTWLVNSAAHVWGFQSWKTGDISMNNWWVGLLAFGEGWHNNHHAFEDSARHGLEWWQIDVTWYLIWTLQKLGLATKVRLPAQKKMNALAIDQGSIEVQSATTRVAT